MGTRVLIVGELTLDDVVVEGSHCDWKQIGGGALYSAIGALAWGASPEISATVGADYPDEVVEALEDSGIDLRGVTRIEGNSLGLWLLYEKGGRRHQVEKDSGSTFEILDRARKPWTETHSIPEGLHVAPQTAEGQLAVLDRVRELDIPVTQDLLIEPFISVDFYRTGEAIAGTTAFLPSQQEVQQIWGGLSGRELLCALRETAGIHHLIVTRGELGADVVTAGGTRRVPPCSEICLDPTGAGDAFSGGFLAGLVETGDAVEATVWGAASASFVVETRGALAAIEALDQAKLNKRAREIRAKVVEI